MKAKASKTKTALYDAMLKASAANSSSRSIVDAVKAEPEAKKAIELEQADIVDLGLMVMADRIAARPAAVGDQGELFSLGRPKEFTVLRGPGPGSTISGRVSTESIQMQQWFDQPKRSSPAVVSQRTNDDILENYFNDMRDKGMPPEMTLGQFIRLTK